MDIQYKKYGEGVDTMLSDKELRSLLNEYVQSLKDPGRAFNYACDCVECYTSSQRDRIKVVLETLLGKNDKNVQEVLGKDKEELLKDIIKKYDLRDKYIKEWSLLDIREKMTRMLSYIDILHKGKDIKELKKYLSQDLYRNFQALKTGTNIVQNYPNADSFLHDYLRSKKFDVSLEESSILYNQALPFLIEGAKIEIHRFSWTRERPDPFQNYDDFRIWLEREEYPEYSMQFDLKCWKKNFMEINEKLWEKDKIYFSPNELELVNKEMKNIHDFILHIQEMIEQRMEKRDEKFQKYNKRIEELQRKDIKKDIFTKMHDLEARISDRISKIVENAILKITPQKYKEQLTTNGLILFFRNYVSYKAFDTWKEI